MLDHQVAGTSAEGSAGTLCARRDGQSGKVRTARARLLWKPSAELWWMCVGRGPHRGIVQGGGEQQGEGQEKKPGTDGLEGVSLLNSIVRWARHDSIPACEYEHREQKFDNRKLLNCVDGDIRRCKAGG